MRDRSTLRRSTLLLSLCLVSLAVAATVIGCGGSEGLTIRRTTPAKIEQIKAPGLARYSYQRILVLPPSGPVKVHARVPSRVAKKRRVDYYLGKIEKFLLNAGFQVVAPEIVARAARLSQGTHSPTERALMMGKETRAHAVLLVKDIRVLSNAKFYHIEDFTEVGPELRTTDDDGNYVHRETGECLYRLPFYELQIEVKLIDVRNGDVLWVGTARSSSLDVLTDDWTVELDDDCDVKDEGPFVYEDELKSAAVFERAAEALVENLLSPVKEVALAGEQIADEEVAAKKAEPKKPAKKIAIVSRSRAPLRQTPSRRGRRIRRMPRKARVEVLESMGEWHKVKVQDGSVGWMHERHIIFPD